MQVVSIEGVIRLDPSEIKDDEEIDVEDTMRRIRENIRMRRDLSKDQEVKTNSPLESNNYEAPTNMTECQRDIEYINSNWDIQNKDYSISSHRQITGKILVKSRELVHGEARRYIDPMIFKQRSFNKSIVRVLNHVIREVIEPESTIEAIRIENKAWLASIFDQKTEKNHGNNIAEHTTQDDGVDYLAFEDRFRGEREDIKRRQSAFLQYLNLSSGILDIGCGRGEFLEILKERGIGAHGIDIDENMVSYCSSKGFDVEKIDAITYLERVEDNSLSSIFIDQVIEHLEPRYMVKMLILCYKKLAEDGRIIAETINPLSLVSFANFYIDMSHKKPVHPATLEFLFESIGFMDVEIRFFSPVPNENRLKKINLEGELSDRERLVGETYNHNIDMLNSILYGPQDYAVFGKK